MSYEFVSIFNYENRLLVRRLGPLVINCEIDAGEIEAGFAALRDRDAMLMWSWEAQLQLEFPRSTAWAPHPTALRRIAEVVRPCLGRARADSQGIHVAYLTETSELSGQLQAIRTAVFVRNHVGLSPDTPITIEIVDITADTPPDLHLVSGS